MPSESSAMTQAAEPRRRTRRGPVDATREIAGRLRGPVDLRDVRPRRLATTNRRTGAAVQPRGLDRADDACAAGRCRRRGRRRCVQVHDPRVHGALHGAPRLQRGRVRRQPPPPGTRDLVRVPRASRRGTDLRAARQPLRARGSRSRRSGGHVRGPPARRADAPAGAGRQVACIRDLHRLRRVGGPGGADRPNRLRPGIGPRAGNQAARASTAAARRLRRRRRDLRNVQRPDRRCLLRARADPRRLRDPLVRLGGTQLGRRRCDRSRGLR